MSVVGEVVGIVACVAALVSAYRDSGVIIDKIKLKRAARRAAPPSRLLEDSIDGAPADIEREKQRGVARFGKAFEHGDHIAVIALQQITIELQSSLLSELRTAACDEDSTAWDLRHLVDVSDSGRDRTVDTLIQFRQRLLAAQPIHEMQPVKTLPDLQPAVQQTTAANVPAFQTTAQKAPILPSPGKDLRHGPTLSTGVTTLAGDDDSASGAETSTIPTRKRHASFLGFFKHQRISSSAHVPSISTQHEETRRGSQSGTSPTSTPTVQPVQSREIPKGVPDKVPGFTYEEWEDDPGKIWGKPSPEPEPEQQQQPRPQARQRDSVAAAHPSSPPASIMSLSRASTSVRSSSVSIPLPTHENDYLGFCKSAARLQNGDRKAFEKCTEAVYAYSRSAYSAPANCNLSCASGKCCFRSHVPIDVIWDKVWVDNAKGLKFRWAFLAKSHVSQKAVQNKQYVFKCLFCAFAGESTPVFHGTSVYIDHVAEHRGPMGEVILYKAGCINDRICEDSEAFDINLYPPTEPDGMTSTYSHLLSDDMMGLTMGNKAELSAHDSVLGANEPWNEGLSDFRYGGDMDRTELE